MHFSVHAFTICFTHFAFFLTNSYLKERGMETECIIYTTVFYSAYTNTQRVYDALPYLAKMQSVIVSNAVVM